MNHDEVVKLARLARLELSEQEIEQLGPQLDRILGFVHQLSELDTSEVLPMTTALDVVNCWADDIVQPGLTREQALAAAPRHDEESFLVPPVLGPL